MAYQIVINLPSMKKFKHTVNENVDAQLEENDDERKGKVVLHILFFDAIERGESNLLPGSGERSVSSWYTVTSRT